MRKKILALTLVAATLLSGCGSKAHKSDKPNKTKADATEATTEDVTQAPTEAPTEPFVFEDKLEKIDENLYSAKSFVGDGIIVSAGAYDATHLYWVTDTSDSEINRVDVGVVDITTGEAIKGAQIESEKTETNYFQAYVMCANPLTIVNFDDNAYYIYSEELDDFKKFSVDDGYCVLTYSSFDDSFYFKPLGGSQIKKIAIEDIEDGKDILDKAETVWKPGYDFGNADLVDISEDGKLLIGATNVIDDAKYYFEYNISDRTTDEVYTADYEQVYLYNHPLSEEYIYADYMTEALIIYSYVVGDRQYEITFDLERYRDPSAELYGGIPMFAEYRAGAVGLDEYVIINAKNYENSDYDDVLLWKYKECETNHTKFIDSKVTVTLAEETRYGAISDEADRIEEKYGVDIILGDNWKNQFGDYTADAMLDEERMEHALKELDATLSCFPEGFFYELIDNHYSGINIYFTGTLYPVDDTVNISNAAAVTSSVLDHQAIVIDVSYDELQSNFMHELTHVIDNWFNDSRLGEALDAAWDANNPEDYEYLYSYFDYDGEFEYTSYSDEFFESMDYELVYFVDTYAKTYATEDHARMFECFTKDGEVPDYYASSHIRGKIKAYVGLMIENFDCVTTDSDCTWVEYYNNIISQE